MNLSFIEILFLIITFFIGIIAVKITFTFDINKYQEKKQKDIENKIKNYCSHAYIWIEGENIKYQSAFISPSWTLNHICQKCGLTLMTLNYEDENERIINLIKNSGELKKQEKKFEKLLKKWWFL